MSGQNERPPGPTRLSDDTNERSAPEQVRSRRTPAGRSSLLHKQLHPHRTLPTLLIDPNGKSAKAERAAYLQSPLTDSNRRPPPYHGTSAATVGNQRQRFSLVSAVFGAAPFAADCHRLQPRGSMRAPPSVVHSWRGTRQCAERPRWPHRLSRHARAAARRLRRSREAAKVFPVDADFDAAARLLPEGLEDRVRRLAEHLNPYGRVQCFGVGLLRTLANDLDVCLH